MSLAPSQALPWLAYYSRLYKTYVSLYRQAPALLERSQWSTVDGNPVMITSTPKSDSDDGWEVVANHSTDSDGWTHGSVFK